VLPPAVAPEQVVVVPIYLGGHPGRDTGVLGRHRCGTRGGGRPRPPRRPRPPQSGFKYNDWEAQGASPPHRGRPQRDGRRRGHLLSPARRRVGHREPRGPARDGRRATRRRLRQSSTPAPRRRWKGRSARPESREEILGTLGQHGGYVRTGWCGDGGLRGAHQGRHRRRNRDGPTSTATRNRSTTSAPSAARGGRRDGVLREELARTASYPVFSAILASGNGPVLKPRRGENRH